VATPFTGSANTAVLLFTGAAVITGPQGNTAIPTWIASANSATDGTSVTIFKPGMYHVALYTQQVASVDVTYGISQDAAAGAITAVPAFATAGILAVARRVTIAGQTQVANFLDTIVTVSPEQSISGSIIRFLAALSGGGAPANTQTAAAAWFRVRKLNDLSQ
jgi:hypothetical protein